MENERYDVIIIGTGAGGGTLAYRLAPTDKRILLLERGDFLPRERDNWDPTAVFVQSKYKAQETWYGKDGRAFHPASIITSAATPNSTAPRCSACARRISARSGTMAGSRPPGRSAMPISSPITARPSGSITSTASMGWIRPNRRRAGPILIRRSHMSRASRSFATGCGPVDTTRSRCLSGSFWTKQRGSRSATAPASAAMPSTAIHALLTARPMPR